MSENVFEQRLELDQGIGHEERIFGYDHENRNFVTWEVVDGKLAIHSVEHDYTEDDCGPLSETRKLAELFLSNENSRQYRKLLASCKRRSAI